MIRSLAPILGKLVLALAFAVLGGSVFTHLGMPAGWLSGAAVAVAIAAIAGLPVDVPVTVRQMAFVLIGTAMGSSASPETLQRLSTWPLSLMVAIVSAALVTLVAYWVLHRLAGWDKVTAFYGAVPGALNYVLAIAIDSKADMPRVVLAQSVRLLFLVAVLPPVIGALSGHGAPQGPVVSHQTADLLDLLLLFGGGALVGVVMLRLGQPSGMLLGPLLFSAGLHVTGTVTTWLPTWLFVPGLLIMGSVIGTRFVGTDRGLLVSLVVAALGALIAGLGVALVAAALLIEITGLPAGQVILAIAPGALDSMTTLAYLLGFDAAYVASLHFIRFLAITAVLPFITRRLGS